MNGDGVSQEQPRRWRFAFGLLGARLLVPFVLGAIVSVVIVVLLVTTSINNQREQIASNQREGVQRLSAQVSNFVNQTTGDLKVVVNAVTMRFLTRPLLDQVMQSALRGQSAFLDLALIGPDGRETARAVGDKTIVTNLSDRSASPEYQAAIAGQNYVGPVQLNRNGVPYVTMAMPVIDGTGQATAVAAVQVDLRSVCTFVCSAAIGRQGYAYLIDQSGNLIAFQDAKMVGHPATAVDAVNAALHSTEDLLNPQSYTNSLIQTGQSTLADYASVPVNDSTKW